MQLFGNYNASKVKVLAFDFDETMYYSEDIKEYYAKYILKVVQDITGKSYEESYNLLELYGFFNTGEKRISFGKNCEKFGVTKEQWNDYRIENFFQINYANAVIANNELYTNLAKKYKLVIVSNEVLENVKYKADKLNVDLSPFTKIYAPNKANVKTYNSNKKEAFSNIANDFNVNYDEIFAIGDRYSVDIEPLVTLGGNGLMVEKVNEIEEFFSK